MDHSKVLVSVCQQGRGRSASEFNSEEGAEGHDRDGFLDELQRNRRTSASHQLTGLIEDRSYLPKTCMH